MYDSVDIELQGRGVLLVGKHQLSQRVLQQ